MNLEAIIVSYVYTLYMYLNSYDSSVELREICLLSANLTWSNIYSFYMIFIYWSIYVLIRQLTSNVYTHTDIYMEAVFTKKCIQIYAHLYNYYS